MAYPWTSRSSSVLVALVLSLAISCKAQAPADMSQSGGASSAGATGHAGAKTTKDASSMVAPVQLPWVPHSDAPTCQHVVVEMSCSNGWCRIPAGCFVAGSPEDEVDRGARNEELATVYLTHPFEISQYEVTRAVWTNSGRTAPMESGPFGGNLCTEPQCPMARVSLFGAMQYANWLSEQAGLASCYALNNCSGTPEYAMMCDSVTVNAASVYECEGYRLPTEVEWEYAARAGARTTFFAGPMSPAVAADSGNCVQEPTLEDWEWYCFNTPDERAHPVGRKGANAWGLHDVQGNLTEFVSNPAYTSLAPSPTTDPWGMVDVSLPMATRGGYFSGATTYSRLARRITWRISGDAITGFRLVRTLKQ